MAVHKPPIPTAAEAKANSFRVAFLRRPLQFQKKALEAHSGQTIRSK